MPQRPPYQGDKRWVYFFLVHALLSYMKPDTTVKICNFFKSCASNLYGKKKPSILEGECKELPDLFYFVYAKKWESFDSISAVLSASARSLQRQEYW